MLFYRSTADPLCYAVRGLGMPKSLQQTLARARPPPLLPGSPPCSDAQLLISSALGWVSSRRPAAKGTPCSRGRLPWTWLCHKHTRPNCSDVLAVAVTTGLAINPTGLEELTPEAPVRCTSCGPTGDVPEASGCSQLPDTTWPSTASSAPGRGCSFALCPLELALLILQLFGRASVQLQCVPAPAPGGCHVGLGEPARGTHILGHRIPICACYSMQWCLRSAHHDTNIRDLKTERKVQRVFSPWQAWAPPRHSPGCRPPWSRVSTPTWVCKLCQTLRPQGTRTGVGSGVVRHSRASARGEAHQE